MGYPDRAEVVGIRDSGGQITSEEGKERARAPRTWGSRRLPELAAKLHGNV
jgi:hypothetical protein